MALKYNMETDFFRYAGRIAEYRLQTPDGIHAYQQPAS